MKRLDNSADLRDVYTEWLKSQSGDVNQPAAGANDEPYPRLVPIVDVDLRAVESWDDFHDAFANALGFPIFYGRNMDACIDCLTGADDDDGLRSIVVEPGDVLTLNLVGASALRDRHPEIHASMVDGAAFVNWRRIEAGERPILAVSYR